MRLYVYYKVRLADVGAAVDAFKALPSKQRPELLRRPEVQDGLETWMEVYPEALLSAEAVVADTLRTWVVGERHREQFERLA